MLKEYQIPRQNASLHSSRAAKLERLTRTMGSVGKSNGRGFFIRTSAHQACDMCITGDFPVGDFLDRAIDSVEKSLRLFSTCHYSVWVSGESHFTNLSAREVAAMEMRIVRGGVIAKSRGGNPAF